MIRELEQVLSIVKDAETGARGYLLSKDNTYLGPYDQATRTIGPELATLQGLVAQDGGSQKEIQELGSLIEKRMEFLRSRIGDLRGGIALPGKPDSALLFQGEVTMDRLRRTQRSIRRASRSSTTSCASRGRSRTRTSAGSTTSASPRGDGS